MKNAMAVRRERALSAPLAVDERVDLKADAGGYYTLRAPSGFVFTRAASFRPARPRPIAARRLMWRGQTSLSTQGL